jgi:hypothetical protein
MVVYFAPIGSGIGDIVVCKPAAEWLARHSSEPVFLVVRGPRQVGLSRLIDGVAGEVIELELKGRLSGKDRLINLRDHDLQRKHDWFAPEFKSRFPNLRIAEILEEICSGLEIRANHREIKELFCRKDVRSQNAIVLVPGTTLKSKTLTTRFWLKLHEELRCRNHPCLMLGSVEHSRQTQELVELGIPHLATEDLQEAINLLANAKAVVSVDTGLMHLAVQQGVRTVAIFGVCEVYYRPVSNCLPIFTDDGSPLLQLGSDYPIHEFPAEFDNWNYFPSTAEDGDYIRFMDTTKVLDLLELEGNMNESPASVGQ